MRSQASIEKSRRLSREAKRRRTGICESCGNPTSYNGLTNNGPSRVCRPCSAVERGLAKRGTGSAETAILAFIAKDERRLFEIAAGVGITWNHAHVTLHRLMRYGMVERPRRGVYRRVAA